jgi:hypothetical protein
MGSVTSRVVIAPSAPRARTVNVQDPSADGLPEMVPDVDRESPLGSDPDASDHV